MSSPDQQTLNEIAWNGIRFLAPADWLPARIEPDYLVLERDSIPVFEIKWGRIKGSFSCHRHLQQLSKLHKKKTGRIISSCKLPANWEKALTPYQAAAFRWQGSAVCGMGAILYCPACRNAAMIQFYQSGRAPANGAATRLLASFRDHSGGKDFLWSAFDIRAEIPSFFQLRRHRFEAGYFELNFASKAHSLVLNRWGPASILLAGRNLARFAASVIDFPETAAPALSGDHPPALAWNAPPPEGRWVQMANRFKIKQSLQQLHMWSVPEKNRILAVRTEGRKPLDRDIFEAICKGFRCV